MKRVLVGLCIALALTSCSLTEPIPIKGEVVEDGIIRYCMSDNTGVVDCEIVVGSC